MKPSTLLKLFFSAPLLLPVITDAVEFRIPNRVCGKFVCKMPSIALL